MKDAIEMFEKFSSLLKATFLKRNLIDLFLKQEFNGLVRLLLDKVHSICE